MAYRKIPSAEELVDPSELHVQVGAAIRNAIHKAAGEAETAVLAAIGKALPATAEEFHALELKLVSLAKKSIAGSVLEAVLAAVHADSTFVWSCVDKARYTRGLTPGGSRSVKIRLLGGGTAKVVTPYMLRSTKGRRGSKRKNGRHGVGGSGCWPVLSQLGIVDEATPALQSEVAWANTARGSIKEAQDTLRRRGLDLHVNTIRRLTYRFADAGLQDREAEDRTGLAPLAGKRVVIAIDGGRLRMRHNKRGRKRSSGWHGYETPWREPKLMAVYTVGPDGKKDNGYVFYEATLAPYDEAFAIFARCLRKLGVAQAEEVVFAADGSRHIWDRVPAAINELGLEAARVRSFVDFWHAAQHVHDASKLVAGLSKYEATLLAKKWQRRLRDGMAAAIGDAILIESKRRRGEARTLLENHAAYFHDNVDRMRYPELTEAGLPKGTGVVESAIRRVVNLRMKSTGTFWTEENAERMLFLRTRLKSGHWADLEAAARAGAFGLRGAALQARQKTKPPAVLRPINAQRE